MCKIIITQTRVYVKKYGTTRKSQLTTRLSQENHYYYSHFINCPGLLKHVFEEPYHNIIIKYDGRKGFFFQMSKF